jgi:hypothetical protein
MDKPSTGLRRIYRQEYLRQHQEQRRADDKAAGARRIDVTLRGEMLDDYERVRRSLEDLNRLMIERGVFNTPRTGHDGLTVTMRPFRLSDTEVIKFALSIAASPPAHLPRKRRSAPAPDCGGNMAIDRKLLTVAFRTAGRTMRSVGELDDGILIGITATIYDLLEDRQRDGLPINAAYLDEIVDAFAAAGEK